MTKARSLLRDELWQFIGAAATVFFGIVTIVITYSVFFLERETKALQITVLSNTSIAEIKSYVSKDITILYKNQPVDDLSLITVQLQNGGNRAIRVADYVRPIRFVFPSSAEVVEAAVIDTNPANIGVTIQTEQNVVTLLPVLLNENDWIILRFLVIHLLTSGDDPQPFEIDVRIAEVRTPQIKSAVDEYDSADEVRFLSIGSLVLSVIFLLLSFGVYFIGRIRLLERSREEVKDSLDQIRRGLA